MFVGRWEKFKILFQIQPWMKTRKKFNIFINIRLLATYIYFSISPFLFNRENWKLKKKMILFLNLKYLTLFWNSFETLVNSKDSDPKPGSVTTELRIRESSRSTTLSWRSTDPYWGRSVRAGPGCRISAWTTWDSRYQLNSLPSMDQISTKTPNPKCRLYWCLIEFRDWRYSQSC